MKSLTEFYCKTSKHSKLSYKPIKGAFDCISCANAQTTSTVNPKNTVKE